MLQVAERVKPTGKAGVARQSLKDPFLVGSNALIAEAKTSFTSLTA